MLASQSPVPSPSLPCTHMHAHTYRNVHTHTFVPSQLLLATLSNRQVSALGLKQKGALWRSWFGLRSDSFGPWVGAGDLLQNCCRQHLLAMVPDAFCFLLCPRVEDLHWAPLSVCAPLPRALSVCDLTLGQCGNQILPGKGVACRFRVLSMSVLFIFVGFSMVSPMPPQLNHSPPPPHTRQVY